MSLFKGNIAIQSEFPDLESLSDELSLMQKKKLMSRVGLNAESAHNTNMPFSSPHKKFRVVALSLALSVSLWLAL